MIAISGEGLTLEQVEAVARGGSAVRGGIPVRLDEDAARQVRRSRAVLERLLAGDTPVYGVNTGFGRLADIRIARDGQRALQRNLVRSHAAGAGAALSAEEVRAILLLRANALARGQSGCRPVVIERLLELLNHGIHPVVPEIGSVGASGDLAPLAHVALALMGEGRAEAGGEEGDAGELLAAAGIAPLELAEKEGLALVNGTQAVTGIGILAVQRFGRALDTADVAGGAPGDAPALPRRDPRRAAASRADRECSSAACTPGRVRGPRVAPDGGSARAGRLFAALHAAGARRGSRGACLRAPHPGHRGELDDR